MNNDLPDYEFVDCIVDPPCWLVVRGEYSYYGEDSIWPDVAGALARARVLERAGFGGVEVKGMPWGAPAGPQEPGEVARVLIAVETGELLPVSSGLPEGKPIWTNRHEELVPVGARPAVTVVAFFHHDPYPAMLPCYRIEVTARVGESGQSMSDKIAELRAMSGPVLSERWKAEAPARWLPQAVWGANA